MKVSIKAPVNELPAAPTSGAPAKKS